MLNLDWTISRWYLLVVSCVLSMKTENLRLSPIKRELFGEGILLFV